MVEETKEKDYKAYVIDLGSGILAGAQNIITTANAREYSICYAGPEVLRKEQSKFKSDIWSLGCVLYFMCT